MNKNKKGFTLVELVVVMAILSILLGAILNLVKPVNTLFTKTSDSKETNDISSGVMTYLENNLRYATNITILEDYQGVPSVTNGVVGVSTANRTKYTDVLIIDSNSSNVRGSSLSSYDSTSNSARRKGAYGQILRCKLSETGTIDLEKTEIALDEGFYGDFAHDLDVNINKDSSNRYYLNTKMTIFNYVLNGSTYEFTNQIFDTDRSFELINVNLSKGCSLNDYRNTAEILNYSLYPQASSPSGLTTAQSAYYDSSKTYTYIFFTTVTPSTNAKCHLYVNQLVDTNALTYSQVWDQKVKNTDCLTEAQYDNMVSKISNTSYTTTDLATGSTVYHTFKDFVDSGTGTVISKDTIASTPITFDMTLIPEYTERIVTPTNKVYFYGDYTAAGDYMNPAQVIFSFSINNDSSSANYGSLMGVTNVADAYVPVDKTFDGWFDASGNQYVAGMTFDPAVDTIFYARYSERVKYTVNFVVDGSAYDSDITDIYAGTVATSLTLPGDPTKADNTFVGWFTEENGAGTEWTSAVITNNTTFYAYFMSALTDLTITSVPNPTFAWWGVASYSVVITNPTSSDINRWQVNFDCSSGDVTGFSQCDWRLGGAFSSGSGSIVTKNDYTIPAGGSVTVEFKLAANISDSIKPGMELSNVTVVTK